MREFETLPGFLEHVALVMENDTADAADKVNVMTLHGAKGLEFESVFLPGWEEGLFPHQRALDEDGLAGLEEERRLAYVGLTRARHRAMVLHAANRLVYNQWQSALPSRFIEELPEDHIARDDVARPRPERAGSFPTRGFGDGWYREGGPRRPAPVIDAEAVTVPVPQESRFRAGDRVFHQKFGYGRVASVDGDKLLIDFEKSGSKKVMDGFVEPA